MAVKDGKTVKKRNVESIGNLCPYCSPSRDFTSRWYLEEHIKQLHPEKRKSKII